MDPDDLRGFRLHIDAEGIGIDYQRWDGTWVRGRSHRPPPRPEPEGARSVRPGFRERAKGYTNLWEVPCRVEGTDSPESGSGALATLQSV